jgi:hypothetical protein
VEYVRIEQVIAQPIGTMWGMVAAFGAIVTWIDGVESCALVGEGVGAIRSVTRGGNLTRERLEAIDPVRHSISYALIPPYRVPATDVRATITLEAVDAEHTRMTWVSTAATIDGPIEELAAYIGQFYRASIANLENLLKRS